MAAFNWQKPRELADPNKARKMEAAAAQAARSFSAVVARGQSEVDARRNRQYEVRAKLEEAKRRAEHAIAAQTEEKIRVSQYTIFRGDFVINDLPATLRSLLTNNDRLGEIAQQTKTYLTVKGRQLSPREKSGSSERALYLYIEGPSEAAVQHATEDLERLVERHAGRKTLAFIEKLNYFDNQHHSKKAQHSRDRDSNSDRGNRGDRDSRRERDPTPPGRQGPPPGVGQPFYTGPPPELHEKIYLELENCDPAFQLLERIAGPGDSYLRHITATTGAQITIQKHILSKGAGQFIEEPYCITVIHDNPEQFAAARQLTQDLVNTVKRDYQQFLFSRPPALALGPAPVAPPQPAPAPATINYYQPQFAVPPPQQQHAVHMSTGFPRPPGQELVIVQHHVQPQQQQQMVVSQAAPVGPPPVIMQTSGPSPGEVVLVQQQPKQIIGDPSQQQVLIIEEKKMLQPAPLQLQPVVSVPSSVTIIQELPAGAPMVQHTSSYLQHTPPPGMRFSDQPYQPAVQQQSSPTYAVQQQQQTDSMHASQQHRQPSRWNQMEPPGASHATTSLPHNSAAQDWAPQQLARISGEKGQALKSVHQPALDWERRPLESSSIRHQQDVDHQRLPPPQQQAPPSPDRQTTYYQPQQLHTQYGAQPQTQPQYTTGPTNGQQTQYLAPPNGQAAPVWVSQQQQGSPQQQSQQQQQQPGWQPQPVILQPVQVQLQPAPVQYQQQQEVYQQQSQAQWQQQPPPQQWATQPPPEAQGAPPGWTAQSYQPQQQYQPGPLQQQFQHPQQEQQSAQQFQQYAQESWPEQPHNQRPPPSNKDAALMPPPPAPSRIRPNRGMKRTRPNKQDQGGKRSAGLAALSSYADD